MVKYVSMYDEEKYAYQTSIIELIYFRYYLRDVSIQNR